MNIYSLIPIVCIILSLGYWFYIKSKVSQQVQAVDSTDFKAEFANAAQYKNQFLTSELPFLKKAMEQSPIDAFNYANIEHNMVDALKRRCERQTERNGYFGNRAFHYRGNS